MNNTVVDELSQTPTNDETPARKNHQGDIPDKLKILERVNVLLEEVAELNKKIPSLLKQRDEKMAKLQEAKDVLDRALRTPSPIDIYLQSQQCGGPQTP